MGFYRILQFKIWLRFFVGLQVEELMGWQILLIKVEIIMSSCAIY